MNGAFGAAVTIPASDRAKTQMKQLVTQGLFKEQRDVWQLGAALGIAKGRTKEGGKRETFQNVNSLDPDGIFGAIMLGLYPNLKPEERLKKLVDHAEWGVNEIAHENEIGTLDFYGYVAEMETTDNQK
jgi:hypothetical protein